MDDQHIRIVLIHGNRLLRDCLCCCLEQEDSLTVVCSASKLEEAGEKLALDRPDLLIVGFDLLHRSGVDNFSLMRAMSCGTKTFVIEVPETETEVFYCIEKVGACGYLNQDASINDFLIHIRAILQGETFCSPRIASLMFSRMSDLARRVDELGAANGGHLTKRETEIMGLIDGGLSNKEIAVQLQIEVSTVKNHVHNILDKLQLHDRRSAVKYVKAQVPSSRSL